MKIYLHGKIGKKFGKEWDLNVTSPNEALRAIDANTGNFFKYLASKQDENIFIDSLLFILVSKETVLLSE